MKFKPWMALAALGALFVVKKQPTLPPEADIKLPQPPPPPPNPTEEALRQFKGKLREKLIADGYNEAAIDFAMSQMPSTTWPTAADFMLFGRAYAIAYMKGLGMKMGLPQSSVDLAESAYYKLSGMPSWLVWLFGATGAVALGVAVKKMPRGTSPTDVAKQATAALVPPADRALVLSPAFKGELILPKNFKKEIILDGGSKDFAVAVSDEVHRLLPAANIVVKQLPPAP